MKHLKIKDDVFSLHLDFFYDCEFNEIKEKIEWMDEINAREQCKAKFLSSEETGENIIWVKNYNVATLAHELLHFVFQNLKDRWIIYCSESEEIFCYLQEYFLRKILEEVNK